MVGFDTYDDLLDTIGTPNRDYQILGYVPGGDPIVAVEAGGEQEPPIFITAGAHATEHAGVCAAVELIEALDTPHKVYIIPSRDPIGLNGYADALGLALGTDVDVTSYDDAKEILEADGEIVHQDGEFVLALIGDYGYAMEPPQEDSTTILQRLKEYAETDPEVLMPFAGRRIFTTPGHSDIDGTEGLNRAYTLMMSPDGMPLHLNRFFTATWAPVETRCVRQLMDEVEPGLTFDNHETVEHETRYHISLRPQRTESADRQECRIAEEITTAVADTGVRLATDEDILAEPTLTVAHTEEHRDESFYSRAGDGAYWVDPNLTSPPRLGEGFNATDYAAEQYGLAYTLETGMYGSLEQRVDTAVTSIQTGVRAFERRHR